MAEFSKLIITQKGKSLIADALEGGKGVVFTKVRSSNKIYDLEELETLEQLSDIKQECEVSKVTRISDEAVTVETAFTNEELTIGYYMRAIGLYAEDSEKKEILYAAAIETSGNSYMPDKGATVSSAYIELIIAVSNAESISLEVSNSAFATTGDIKDLQAQINTISLQVGGITGAENAKLDELSRLGKQVFYKEIRFKSEAVNNEETIQVFNLLNEDFEEFDKTGQYMFILEPIRYFQSIRFESTESFRHFLGHLEFNSFRSDQYYQHEAVPLCLYRVSGFSGEYTAQVRFTGHLRNWDDLHMFALEMTPLIAEVKDGRVTAISESFKIDMSWKLTVFQSRVFISHITGDGSSGEGTISTNDYKSLINKPAINNVTLVGNLTSKDLGLELSGGGECTEMTAEEMDAILE